MAFASTHVTVSSSAATALADWTGTDRAPGASVIVRNTDGSIVVYLGGSNVSSANGLSLAAGASTPVIQLQEGETLYARAASGSPVVEVLKGGA